MEYGASNFGQIYAGGGAREIVDIGSHQAGAM